MFPTLASLPRIPGGRIVPRADQERVFRPAQDSHGDAHAARGHDVGSAPRRGRRKLAEEARGDEERVLGLASSRARWRQTPCVVRSFPYATASSMRRPTPSPAPRALSPPPSTARAKRSSNRETATRQPDCIAETVKPPSLSVCPASDALH